MNKQILLSAFFGLSLVAAASVPLYLEEHYQHAFVRFISKYNKRYTADSFFQRYNVFKANMDFIEEHNNANYSYTVAMNAFGDMSAQEFAASRNGAKSVDRSVPHTVGQKRRNPSNPASVDWRSVNAVTPVKDQGQCGSCWAFSSTGGIEGVWSIAGHGLVSLSEQQLVDCSSAQGNGGCNGGWYGSAWQYVISNNGITGEADYPYTAQDGTCQAKGKPVRATLASYNSVQQNSDSALENAVAINPTSVAIEADQSSFQFYSGGIFSDASCGTTIDHAVLAVGYNVQGSAQYWIVKNIWGTGWGLAGYIYMARGSTNSGKGVCGINQYAEYPVV